MRLFEIQRRIRGILVLLSIFLLLPMLSSCQEEDPEERKAAIEDSYAEGYRIGLADGEKRYDDGYEEGYREGLAAGEAQQETWYKEGYEDGLRDGYEEGYAAGVAETPAGTAAATVYAAGPSLSDTVSATTSGSTDAFASYTVYVSRKGVIHKRSNCSGMKHYTEMTYASAVAAGSRPFSKFY